jgi:hypothetical protein
VAVGRGGGREGEGEGGGEEGRLTEREGRRQRRNTDTLEKEGKVSITCTLWEGVMTSLFGSTGVNHHPITHFLLLLGIYT